jgi:threonylcarbamoyladenosine tRNA methylthiotransferase MtaB
MNGKYRLTTLGCKVNQYESQLLRQTLEAAGFTAAVKGEPHDIAVVNTCAVTNEATRKSRQSIRSLSRKGTTPVVVVGCYASAERERIGRIDGVMAVAGHEHDAVKSLRDCLDRLADGHSRLRSPKDHPNSMIDSHSPAPKGAGADQYAADQYAADQYALSGEADQIPGRSDQTRTYEFDHRQLNDDGAEGTLLPLTVNGRSADSMSIPSPLPIVNTIDEMPGRIDSFAGHQRAFLKIQDGCDAYCTYCIIPQLRPELQSKSIDAAVDEATGLVRAGHREIVLTGIFLGAYGRETALRRRWNSPAVSPLAQLVDTLARIEGLDRLRLSSLEPGDIDADLLAVVADHENCVPHFHLPLQSGSAEILRRMNRQYTRTDYLNMIDQVRTALHQPAISSDIIVGFPGESDQDFLDSLEVARHAEFCKIHAFPFSPRAKTAAAKWTREFVPPSVIKRRMDQLREIEQETSFAFRSRLVGFCERLIVESVTKEAIVSGHADRFVELTAFAPNTVKGDLLNVLVTDATPGRTHAQVIDHNHQTVLPDLAVPGQSMQRGL